MNNLVALYTNKLLSHRGVPFYYKFQLQYKYKIRFLLMSNLEDESTDSACFKFLNTYAMLLKKAANSEKFQQNITKS